MRLASLATIDGGDEFEALVITEAADLFLKRDWGRVACANRIGSLMDTASLDAAQGDLEEIRGIHQPEAAKVQATANGPALQECAKLRVKASVLQFFAAALEAQQKVAESGRRPRAAAS